MGIVDWFRPKHKHSDAKERLAAVEAMSSDETSLLASIARTDKDPTVRRAAIQKLDEVDILADIFDREQDGALRDLAGSRAAELWTASACQDDDPELARNALAGLIKVGDQKALAEVASRAEVQELRGKALAELRDPRALAEVARSSGSPELKQKAIAKIDDASTLRGLAIDAAVKELGLAAVERIKDAGVLEQVAQKAKQKAVRQRARKKLDDQAATAAPAAGPAAAAKADGGAKAARVSDELLRRRAEKAQVLRSVESLAEHHEWTQSLETVKNAEREWSRLGDTGEPERDERFARAVARYHEHRDAALRAVQDREAEIYASAEARREAEERAAAERAERAARRARKDADDGDVVNEAAMALMRPAPLTDEQKAARDAEQAKRREAWAKRKAEDEARRAEETAARAARAKEQEERGTSLVKSLRALVDEMASLTTSQDGKAIERLLAQAATAFGQLGKVPAGERDELDARYREVRGQLVVKLQEAREGEDWKRWANVPRAENLVAAAKELADREEQPTLDILKELQRMWKDLGPLPQKKSQELWEQFKGHADRAFDRIRGVREVEKAKMGENAAAREALIAEAEKLADSTEWEATAAALKELQAKWKATGPVPRKQGDDLWKRFRAACDKFFERRKPLLDAQHAELEQNLVAKRRLIERAQAVVAKAPGERGWGADIGAIKDLQREWKEIGHVPRAEVEKLWQEFRAACDGLFAKRDASRDAEGNARRAELEALKTELVAVTEAASAGEADAVPRALAVRKQLLEVRAQGGQLGAELDGLLDELQKTIVVIHAGALKGTELDPTAMASKRSKLIGRASDLLPAERPQVDASASPEAIAKQLAAAMKQNALFKGDGRNPLEVLEELQAEWRAVGPVIGRDAERQAERFEEICAELRDAFGGGEGERRSGGERRSERRARADRRKDEGGAAATPAAAAPVAEAAPEPVAAAAEAVTTPVLPLVETPPAAKRAETAPAAKRAETAPPPAAQAKAEVVTIPMAAKQPEPVAPPVAATKPEPAPVSLAKPAETAPPPVATRPATVPPPVTRKPTTLPPPVSDPLDDDWGDPDAAPSPAATAAAEALVSSVAQRSSTTATVPAAAPVSPAVEPKPDEPASDANKPGDPDVDDGWG